MAGLWHVETTLPNGSWPYAMQADGLDLHVLMGDEGRWDDERHVVRFDPASGAFTTEFEAEYSNQFLARDGLVAHDGFDGFDVWRAGHRERFAAPEEALDQIHIFDLSRERALVGRSGLWQVSLGSGEWTKLDFAHLIHAAQFQGKGYAALVQTDETGSHYELRRANASPRSLPVATGGFAGGEPGTAFGLVGNLVYWHETTAPHGTDAKDQMHWIDLVTGEEGSFPGLGLLPIGGGRMLLLDHGSIRRATATGPVESQPLFVGDWWNDVHGVATMRGTVYLLLSDDEGFTLVCKDL